MASGSNTLWQIEGGEFEAVTDFVLLGSIITAEITVAMKLKDSYSFKGKLWQT